MSITLVNPEAYPHWVAQAVVHDEDWRIFIVVGEGPHFNAGSRLYFGDYARTQFEYVETEHTTLTRSQFNCIERTLKPINIRHGRSRSLRGVKQDDLTAHLVQRVVRDKLDGYFWRPWEGSPVVGSEGLVSVTHLPSDWGPAWSNASLRFSNDLETLYVTLPPPAH